MIKVTLLGDSIRMFYGKRVVDLLGDNYDVFQPEENCRFSKYTLRGLYQWKEGIEGSDIIHWNNDCGIVHTVLTGLCSVPLTNI